jgi:hypothetical protein
MSRGSDDIRCDRICQAMTLIDRDVFPRPTPIPIRQVYVYAVEPEGS